MKESNLQVGQVGMHVGAISPKHSKESVSREAAHFTPLPLPWDPGNDRDLPGVAKTGLCRKVRLEDSQERLEVQMAPRGMTLLSSGLQGQVGCKNPPAPFPRILSKDAQQTKSPNDSPRDRGESQTQPPKGDVQRNGHASPKCMSEPSLEIGGKNVDSVCQHIICDSNHVVEQSIQQSHQPCKSMHMSQMFQSGLRVLHSASK